MDRGQNSTKNSVGLNAQDIIRDMDLMHALPDGSLKHFLMYDCVESIHMQGLIDFFRQNPDATLRDAEISLRQHSRRQHIKVYTSWAGDYPK